MRSLMRRLAAGVVGLLAVATMATLVTAAPSGAATAAPGSHIYSTALRWPVVGPGARGERVFTIQYLLQQRRLRVFADGIYGRQTTAAVRAFQRSRGLRATGVVAASTWNRLITTVRRGSAGPAVRAVQHSMRFAYGFRFQRVTGFFGLQTLRVVLAFQHSSHLRVDGIVGPQTWITIVVFER
jgi:peptidoglycan hydrolase-like protein with peptidoglycan-binding domain